MAEAVNPYNIGTMTGCTEGKVPVIPDIYAIIRGRHAVKLILLDGSVSYGLIDSYNKDRNTINFTMPGAAENGKARQLYALSLSAARIFLATPLDKKIPAVLETTLIINGELFTVVDTSCGIPIWVGDGNLVYYPEDIQTLIYVHGGPIVLI